MLSMYKFDFYVKHPAYRCDIKNFSSVAMQAYFSRKHNLISSNYHLTIGYKSTMERQGSSLDLMLSSKSAFSPGHNQLYSSLSLEIH